MALWIVPTPIGNLGDSTQRARETLAAVTLILCEDTRVTARLRHAYGITTPCRSLHKHNEQKQVAHLCQALHDGADFALVSDAGTPCLNDPGARLIQQCRQEGIRVETLPGPSAITTFTAGWGWNYSPIVFWGFFPKKKAEAHTLLQQLIPGGHLFFESAQRIHHFLACCDAIHPNAMLYLAKEMTKKFEERWCGTAAQLHQQLSTTLKGEWTVGCHITPPRAEHTPATLLALLQKACAEGLSPSQAIAKTAKRLAISKNKLYQLWHKAPPSST